MRFRKKKLPTDKALFELVTKALENQFGVMNVWPYEEASSIIIASVSTNVRHVVTLERMV